MAEEVAIPLDVKNSSGETNGSRAKLPEPTTEVKTVQPQAEKSEVKSFKVLMAEFVDFTTSHGITHVYKAAGRIKKISWTILSVMSLVALLVHLGFMISDYAAFDVATNVDILEKRAIVFPAVTICDNNGIKQSQLPQILDDLISSKRKKILRGSDNVRSTNKIFKQISEEVSRKNSTARQALGYSYRDLIVYCTFRGENCYEDEFWTFYDSVYGNCYSFNTGRVGNYTIERSNLAGASDGLSLVVNVGVYDYIPLLTEDAGIRVVIHDQKAMPFPSRSGQTASPGQVNNFAVKRILLTRLDGKYGTCTRLTMNKDNAYFDPYNVSYTQWACLQTCYQRRLILDCQCFDPNIPYDPDTPVFSRLTPVDRPCSIINSKDAKCTKRISDYFADRTLACTQCSQPCRETLFESSLSTSTFPAASYVSNFLKLLNASHPNLVRTLEVFYGEGETHLQRAVQTNFLKLNVFYKEMTITSFSQIPSYGDFQFISDLGGAFGLWIGWSVLTFFELFELLIDMCRYARRKHHKTRKS